MPRRDSAPVLSVLLVTLLFAGCGDGSTAPEDSPVGTYTLMSVNGTALPFVLLQILENKIEVTAGQLSLNADGTCSAGLTTRTTEDGAVTTETDSLTCTWTNTNNAVSFSWSDGTSDGASWSGNTVTVTDDGGLVLLFER